MADLENKENEKEEIVSDDEDVTKYFTNALAKHDEELEKEQNENPRIIDTHNAEIVAPILCLGLAIMSLFDKFWFTAYFGLFFGGIGIFICKKKNGYVAKWVLLFNIIALAASILIGGFWIILYVAEKV